MNLVWTFWRGVLIVSLVSWNVRHIAAMQYGAAFCTGTGISAVWWANAKAAAHSKTTSHHVAYALGAGCGTLIGMWLGR